MTAAVYWVGTFDVPRRYRIDAGDVANAAVGGEGIVYRATAVDGTRVALKQLTALDRPDIGRLVERSRPFVGVRHPNLMAQIEVFSGSALSSEARAEVDDIVYSVAGWIEGTSLAAAAPTMTTRDAVMVLAGIADGLHALHTVRSIEAPNGLVHRDVKPSNVRIDDSGAPVLIDFGIARPVVEGDLTVGAGTYRWRAPEVLTGTAPIGVAADVWALGAIGHWMLTGEPPSLDGAKVARERMLATPRCAELSDPVAVTALIAALLESDPHRRPTDLQRWADELRRRVDRRRRRRSSRLLLAGAGLSSMAVAAIAWSAVDGDSARGGSVGVSPMSEEVSSSVVVTTPAPTTSESSLDTTADTTVPVPTAEDLRPGGAAARLDLVTTSVDGSLVAAVDADGALRAWRTSTGEVVVSAQAIPGARPAFDDGRERGASLVIAFDASLVAWTDEASVTRVWETDSGELVAEFASYGVPRDGPTTGPAVGFNRAGSHLLFVSGEEITAWDARSGSASAVIDVSGDDWSVSRSGDDVTVHRDGVIRIVDTATFDERYTAVESDVLLHAMSPDRSTLALGRSDSVVLVDIGTGERFDIPIVPLVRDDGFDLERLVFSADGTRLAVPEVAFGVRIIDTASGEILTEGDAFTRFRILVPANGLNEESILFSPDGDSVATIDQQGLPSIMPLRTGPPAAPRPLVGHGEPATVIAFDPTGERLVSGGADGSVRVWSTRSGATQFVFTGVSPIVLDVGFSDDGSSVIASFGDVAVAGVRRWDLGPPG
jgi:serine/threonine protein kinase/WD40 repeat protein